MRVWVLVLVLATALTGGAILGARPVAAECRREVTGKPIYREEHLPLRSAGPGEPVPVQTFAIYPSGVWTWVGSGPEGAGEAVGRSGCISPAALREITRAVARATFRFAREPVASCAALPTARQVLAAPRRGMRLVTEAPCGQPPDRSTRRLRACARAVMQDAPPADADLRAICRRGA